MTAKLPNLELIEYKAKEILGNNKDFISKLESIKEESATKGKTCYVILEYDIETFPQVWGSTATGFDAEGGLAGCAMTKEYTTVVHENVTDFYVIFFGEKPCYLVDEVNDSFLSDLKERRLAGAKEASTKY